MGRCETASASIGIKILLSDLVSQINETNFTLILELLRGGYIEDDNMYFNDVFSEIVGGNNRPTNAVDFKEYVTTEFTNKWSYYKSRGYCTVLIPTIDNGCLLDKPLLVPLKDILTMDRWGHERDGSNCISRPIDFDLSVNIEKYKDIEKTEIVFILGQHAG